MVFAIIALIIVLFVLLLGYREYEKCQKGTGGLLSKVCHILV